MAAAGQWGRAPLKTQEMFEKIMVLKRYCEFIGWKCDEVHINADDVIDDAKIGLLKIATAGDIIHEVGLRVSEEEFYVMREPAI